MDATSNAPAFPPALLGCAERAGDDSLRPWMQSAFGVTLPDGTPAAAATNGYGLLAAHGTYAVEPIAQRSSGKMTDERIAAVLRVPPGAVARRTTVGALRTFCGLAPLSEAPPCDDCRGSGAVPCDGCEGEGDVECTCVSCDHVHDRACDECGGAGEVACRCGHGQRFDRGRPRHGATAERAWVGRQLMNLGNLRPLVLAALQLSPEGDAAAVTWHEPPGNTGAVLTADGWTGVVMPLVERGGDEETRAPRFDGWTDLATVEG